MGVIQVALDYVRMRVMEDVKMVVEQLVLQVVLLVVLVVVLDLRLVAILHLLQLEL